MTCDVTIHDWSEGLPLTFTAVPGPSLEWIHFAIVCWVNRLAGHHHCSHLPAGTRFRVEGGRTWIYREPGRYIVPLPTVTP